MKAQAIRTNEMTLQAFFGRPANEATHNLTGGASATTVATTHDHKEVTMKTQTTTPSCQQIINSAVLVAVVTVLVFFSLPTGAQEISGTLQTKSLLSNRVDLWSLPPSGATLTLQPQGGDRELVPLVSVSSGSTIIATLPDLAPTIVLSRDKNQYGLNELVRDNSLTLLRRPTIPIRGYTLAAGAYQLCVNLQEPDSHRTVFSACSPFTVADFQLGLNNDVVTTARLDQSAQDQATQITNCETGMATVEININVFQKSDGTGNFKNNLADRAAIQQIVDWLNQYQANNSHPSDPIAGVVDQPDTRIRFELGNRIYFYRNDNLNVSSNMTDLQAAVTAVDPNRLNQLNIYFTNGTYGGASGFATLPDFYNLNFDEYAVVLNPYSGWISSYHTTWGAFMTLIHELGHDLNLQHGYNSETCDPTNPDFLDDVFNTPPNEVCYLDGGWSLDPWKYQNWDSTGTFTNPPDTSTNDLMDGTYQAAYYSPKQIVRMHKALCESSASQYVKIASQFRNDPEHTGHNNEKALKSSDAANLLVQWKGLTAGPILSSPAVAFESINNVYRKVVYVASQDGYLYAFDGYGCDFPASSCAPIWKFFVGTSAVSSPAVADEMIGGVQTSVVYVVGGDGNLYAINAVTGAQIWSIGVGGPSAYSSPAVVNGVVYVISGGTLGALFAFDATTGGADLWSGPMATHYPSPAVSNGVVYAGDDFGKLSAFDATGCGSTFCLPLWTSGYFGAFKSSPAVVNGRVYVGSDDGNLYVFDAAGLASCTGKTCQPLWTGKLKGAVHSSPAVADGVVYLTSGDATPPGSSKLYAFDANGVTNCTGTACQPLWIGAINGNFPSSSPVAANGVVYVGSDDGNLYAFDATGCSSGICSPLNRITTGDIGGAYIASSPTVADGWVYVGSSDGHLYGISLCYNICAIYNNPPAAY